MNNIIKRYLTLSTWSDKSSGMPKSSLAEIKGGISKSSGQRYEITDTNSTIIVDEAHPVGTVISYTMTESPDSSAKTSTAKN